MTPPSSAAATAQPARRIAPPRPRTAPARPRRISGPVRPSTRQAPAEATRDGLVVGLLGAAESLSSSRLIDRLIGSRVWIGIIAFALIGIVTLQLGLLKLNASIGRALEHTALLQRENAALSVENSEMGATDRVQARAAGLGMEPVQPGALRFLTSSPRTDPARGAAALSNPLTGSPTGSPTGSAEAALGSGTAAPQSVSSPTGEAATAGTSPSAGQAPATAPATSQASGEHPGTPGGEPKPQSAESTTASPPTSPSAAAPAGGGSAEAAPAGGTQPGSSG